jgi:lipopolysaccharide biosynthesis protein
LTARLTVQSPDDTTRDMIARPPKLIAFYLPQFHAIPENDAWWGEGFSDWVNVRDARPLFAGHRQPRVPHADLGYYDPREPSVLARQAAMARAHGIHGFCFYHYWFGGKKLLEAPIEAFLAAGEIDMPFCLCWANEPWTRAWDGRNRDVLMPQAYGGRREWSMHFDYLLPFLQDPRAMRVEGKPVFLIYRVGNVPRVAEMLQHWRDLAKASGLPGLHIVVMLTAFTRRSDFANAGLDAACEFYPTYAFRPTGLDWLRRGFKMGLHLRALKRWTPVAREAVITVDYEFMWTRILTMPRVFPTQYRGAFVDWDNSPRKGLKAVIMRGSSPDTYRNGLAKQIARACGDLRQEPLVFVNAWNEWAEGAYLEPDIAHGYRYLEATREALASAHGLSDATG